MPRNDRYKTKEEMVRINIFGDFLSKKEMSNICIDEYLMNRLKSGNLNILNYEAPVKSEGVAIHKSGPTHCQHPSTIEWILKNRFTCVTLANNHISDYGVKGMDETIDCFNKVGIKTVGCGSFEESYKPALFSINGIKIAILAFSHFEFGVASDEWDCRYKNGVAWINHPKVDVIISELKTIVDLLIVIPHAGVEEMQQPLPEWRDRYRSLIDLGCDAVIASHPHIIQGYEIYNGKPICYSLGNFFFPKEEKKDKYWYYSLMATLIVEESNKSIRLETTPLKFDNSRIYIVKDDYIISYINQIQQILNDGDKYIEIINKCSIDYINEYNSLFYAGGYLCMHRMTIKTLLKMLYCFITKKEFNIVHALNNIRCESHRYLFLRGIKLKYNIQ